MKMYQQMNILERVSKNELIATDKPVPYEIKEIYRAVKSFLVSAKKMDDANEPETAKITSYNSRNNEKDPNKSVWVGGGCLAELFYKNYKKKAKDVDIFVDLNVFRTLIKKVGGIEGLVEVMNLEIGEFVFENHKTQFFLHYDRYTEIEGIIRGNVNGHPDIPVEIIFYENPNVEYDLSIREFYYFGGSILTTQRALDSIEEETIYFNTMRSPISTLVRSNAFAQRYGFKEDPYTKSWFLKTLKYHSTDFKDVEEAIGTVAKYKELMNLEKLAEEFEQTQVNEEEKQLLEFVWENEEIVEGLVFRQAVERYRAMKENDIDPTKWYEIEVPALETGLSSFKKRGTKEPISMDQAKSFSRYKAQQIKQARFKTMFSKTTDLFDVPGSKTTQNAFSSETIYDLKKAFINYVKNQGYESEYKGDINLTYALYKMDLLIQGYEGVFYEDNSSELYNYGSTEEVKKCVTATKMKYRMKLSNFLVPKSMPFQGEYFRFDIKYGDQDQIQKGFSFDRNTNFLSHSNDSFTYLVGKRYQCVAEQVTQGVAEIEKIDVFNYTLSSLQQKEEIPTVPTMELTEKTKAIINALEKTKDPFEEFGL